MMNFDENYIVWLRERAHRTDRISNEQGFLSLYYKGSPWSENSCELAYTPDCINTVYGITWTSSRRIRANDVKIWAGLFSSVFFVE